MRKEPLLKAQHAFRCISALALAIASNSFSTSVSRAAETDTPGILKAEVYQGISGTPVGNLYSDAKYPDSPDRVRYLSGLTFGQPGFGNTAGDNYGVRITGTITPPQTGNYYFFLRSDDASEFYLNPTGPAIPDQFTSVPIAEETDCCDPFREIDSGDLSTTATPVALEAGKKYGFIFVVKEGGGGDWGQVAWRLEGDNTPANQLTPIQAPYVSAVADATGASVSITQDLADVSIAESDRLVLKVSAQATQSPTAPALVGQPTYQWFKDGKPLVSYRDNHTIGLVRNSHAGKYQVMVMVPGAVATSKEITVTVTPDVTKPTVASARGNLQHDKMTVVFSEPVDEASATTVANYSVSPSLTLSDPVRVNATTVRFSTSAQTPGTEYTVTVNNVKDSSAAANPVEANTQAKFNAWSIGRGFLPIEFFRGINGTPVQNLLDAQKFKDNNPDEVRFLGSIDTPNGYNNNYGARVTGWLIPKESGNYFFFIRSDDASQLYLNATGESIPDPAVDAPIAEETDCCDAFMEPDSGDPTVTAFPIALEAGKRYGLLYLLKEGGGGDWGQVAWRKEGDTTPAAGLRPISGDLFEAYVDTTGAAIDITTQPSDLTVLQNRTGTLTVAATGSSSVTYQWFKNGQEIAGANSASYTLPPVQLSDQGAKFSVRIRVPGLEKMSNEATLTVTPDTVAPTLLGAGAFAGSSTVGVAFDEALDQASAETASNYKVTGATVTAATLHSGRVIELTLSGAVGANFSVTANGVKDLAGNAASNATATGQISDMQAQDLGTPGDNPVELGKAFTWGDGFYVAAGGNDIWGSFDAGYIVYKEFTGPFDVRARVDSLVGGDEWGKATLMARETLEPGSRNQAVLITKTAPYIPPTTGGVNVYNHQWRDAADGNSGSKPGGERISPTVFPSWIRLVRESTASNEMKSYISYDGQNWIHYHTHTTPDPLLPEKLFVGMAATSHDNTPEFPQAQIVYGKFSLQQFVAGAEVPANLGIARDGAQVVITWDAGTLESSSDVSGPYSAVQGATSPMRVTPSQTTFYRVRTQ